MGMTRRSFSREFKLEAARMVSEGGHSLAQVARDLDIRPDMLRRWRRQLEQDPEQAFPGVGQRRARCGKRDHRLPEGTLASRTSRSTPGARAERTASEAPF